MRQTGCQSIFDRPHRATPLGPRRQPGKTNKDCEGNARRRNAGSGETRRGRSASNANLCPAEYLCVTGKGVPLGDRAEPSPTCWITQGNRRIVAARGAAHTTATNKQQRASHEPHALSDQRRLILAPHGGNCVKPATAATASGSSIALAQPAR